MDKRLNELCKSTKVKALKYYKEGEIYLKREGIEKEQYVLMEQTDTLTTFESFSGRTLVVPTENLSSFLPGVASAGMEIIRI